MGTLSQVLDASEDALALLGVTVPTPQQGAAALALALGRVCRAHGVSLEAAVRLVRLAADEDGANEAAVGAVTVPAAGRG